MDHGENGQKNSQSWNQIQTLKLYIFDYIYCAHLWTRVNAAVGAFCAVSNRESELFELHELALARDRLDWGLALQAGIFPEPGPGFEWGTVTKWCDVTFSSHFVTFQVRCDAARFQKSLFKYFQKCDDFPGTWYKCDDFVTSSFFWVRLGAKQSLKRSRAR